MRTSTRSSHNQRLSIADLSAWPTVRDATRLLDVSAVYASQLLRAGRLSGVKTRLGWLIDPRSLEAFDVERQARLATKRAYYSPRAVNP